MQQLDYLNKRHIYQQPYSELNSKFQNDKNNADYLKFKYKTQLKTYTQKHTITETSMRLVHMNLRAVVNSGRKGR